LHLWLFRIRKYLRIILGSGCFDSCRLQISICNIKLRYWVLIWMIHLRNLLKWRLVCKGISRIFLRRLWKCLRESIIVDVRIWVKHLLLLLLVLRKLRRKIWRIRRVLMVMIIKRRKRLMRVVFIRERRKRRMVITYVHFTYVN